ncbi:Cytochrome c [Roseimaritima multifibrata]|uniref:Cytochrome c n=2 Tax=Roseimaritima multifibrata TaxID=1930274 RepID=A0A517MIS7_9BACT|nr:Cytochrome c [Roseimaritima multifibrata]
MPLRHCSSAAFLRRGSFVPGRPPERFGGRSRETVLLLSSIMLVCCLSDYRLSSGVQAAETYADPNAAAANPDFIVQGEYVAKDRAMQVVSRGEGEFDILLFAGGLPGAGWDRTPAQKLEGDADTVADLVESIGLKRIVRSSPTMGATPPQKAIHLFDGSQESLEKNWKPNAKRTEEGLLQEGATTVQKFRDYRLHVEFRTPWMPESSGQARGNSGVYHQGRYETQILDSFGLTGADNETGGIYTVRAPDINLCFPPLQWQTYDVDFTAARFDDAGKKTADARMTARLNGVVVQSDIPVPNATRAAPLKESQEPGPIFLQNHGNPVRFRNVWILPKDAEKEARRPHVPGFERFYGAGDAASVAGGEVLIASLGCVACHQGKTHLPSKQAPDLSRAASRIRPDALLAMIESPHQTKPGTTMPDPWTGVSEEDRHLQARAIASFLSVDQGVLDRPGDTAAANRGEQLYQTIGCRACHDSLDDSATHLATSVPLGDLAQKYTLQSLTAFLADPHSVRPGGSMPRLVSGPVEARDLACYLLRDVVLVPGGERFQYKLYHGNWTRLPDFDALEPVSTGAMQELDLAVSKRKNGFGLVIETFLPVQSSGDHTFHLASDDGSRLTIDGKVVLVHDGIHPATEKSATIKLAQGVYPLKIEYFEGGGQQALKVLVDGPDFKRAELASLVIGDPSAKAMEPLVPIHFKADPALVEDGARLFQSVGCAACHKATGSSNDVAVRAGLRSLHELGSRADSGCLAERPPAGAPDFELTSLQRESIKLALTAEKQERTSAERSQSMLTVFNCYACHERDGIGGPEPIRDPWFTTTTPEMGNEGRMPPSLSGVGDKLKEEYVASILNAGANERPYLKTRMPGFGDSSLHTLPAIWADSDRRTEAEIPPVDLASTVMESHGRKLVGDQGLACIKCHTYDGKGQDSVQAIDMRKMPQRLREDWFHRYMLSPQTYRPGTRMPASFVDGKSALTDVLEGNPASQIDAMWQYLSADNPKPPVGLSATAIVLKPNDTPVIYRNFLSELSPRGIGVGYPEGVNLAWDAESMQLVQIWQNDFIDASKHWIARGQGTQSALGDMLLKVDPGLPLANLQEVSDPWPVGLGRDLGYRFLGYRLDESRQPSFRYRFGSNEVEDICLPLGGKAGERGFERTWIIRSDDPDASRVLRLAVGSIQPLGDGRYRIEGGPMLTIDDPAKAQIFDVDGKQELRVRLPADPEVRVRVTIRW